jgi:hypothetical protein
MVWYFSVQWSIREAERFTEMKDVPLLWLIAAMGNKHWTRPQM